MPVNDRAVAQPGSHNSMGVTYGEPSEVPIGIYRSELCECCICPALCLSCFCPFIVWGQVAKQLCGGSDDDKGMKYFYAIVFGFAFMIFVVACLGDKGNNIGWFIALAYFLLMTSLQRRIRKIYDIKPKICFKSEACDDCCRTVFCMPCATFQMGNHLFDYKSNPAINCDPVPTHFIV